MRHAALTLCAAVSLALAGSSALACGHCAEDRIAAVYDHALSARSVANRHQVAYFAWDGKLAPSEAVRRKIMALTQATPGVAAGSARVSMEPAALAVSFNPQRTSPKALEASLQRQLRPLKISIALLDAPRV